MKKVTYIKVALVPAQPATKRRVEKTYCDVCSLEITIGRPVVHCVLCRRDTHGWWFNNGKCSPEDPRNSGDYPDRYCKFCYDLKFVGEFNKAYNDEIERHDKFVANLDKRIKAISLAKK